MKFKAYEREKPEHTMAYVRISSTSVKQKFAFYSLSESVSGRR